MEEKQILGSGEVTYLINSVKVGDLVDYPVKYENVKDSHNRRCFSTGWQVLAVDKENGIIKLVSSGIPVSFWHTSFGSASKVRKMLKEDFLNIPVKRQKKTFFDVGFENVEYGETLEKVFKNEFTAKVRSMTLGDISRAIGKKIDVSERIRDYKNLFAIGEFYYLASNSGVSDLYLINGVGTLFFRKGFIEGIRIVVYLKSNILTSGKKENKWQLLSKE